ncbi:MAG: hypothetical protein HY898_07940 [Deltaproteobacteria bacterium]|nr:hypothetical protein [Deltaproteobacteria bacterium]
MELPNDTSIRWLVRRYASLLARDTDRKHKLVLPTGEFFPDAFEGDPGSINLLFWRLQEHASLTDLDVELRLVDDRDAEASGCKCGDGGCKDGGCKDGGCKDGGCGTGSCGCGSSKHGDKTLAPVVQLRDGGYRVDVRLSDAKNATTLTSAMATSLAHAFVLETGGFESWPEAEWMSTCEIAATMLGLGVLLTNASYMYSKACKGVNIDQATSLDVSELSVVLALFVALGEHPHGRAVQNLDPTQREAYDEARMWVDSNAKILRRLRRDPGSVAADEHLTVEPARPWLARVLGLGAKKKKTVDLNDEEAVAQIAASMAAKRSGATKREEDPKMAELRALVDESLTEARSSAAEE